MLPNPSSQFRIGRQAFDWLDKGRIDEFSTAPGRQREIMVYVWYPAIPSPSLTPAEYFPDAHAIAQDPATDAVARDIFGPIWPEIVAGNVRSHAVKDARPAQGPHKFPVILFSHGAASTGFSYTAQIENFVSHGYVVVSVEHPGAAGLVRFADGRIRLQQDPTPAPEESHDPMKAAISSAKQEVETGAEDLSFVLNTLSKGQVDIAKIMDLQRVAAVGHSAGGTLSARACQIESRIKACLSEEGAVNPVGIFFDYPDRSHMLQPFFMLQLDEQHSDEELSRIGESRAQWDRYLAHGREQMKTCGAGSYQMTLSKPGLVHASFSDGLLLNAAPRSSEAEGAMANLELTERLEIGFLDSVLRVASQ